MKSMAFRGGDGWFWRILGEITLRIMRNVWISAVWHDVVDDDDGDDDYDVEVRAYISLDVMQYSGGQFNMGIVRLE